VHEGLREALRLVLRRRFGDAGLELLPRIESIGSVDRLRALVEALEGVDRFEDFRRLIDPA
jgi:hypothetical protein